MRYLPCPPGLTDPCGAPGPPPGITEIFVGSEIVCRNTGQTIGQALAAGGAPGILWGGWCWYPATGCLYAVSCSPNPVAPAACCELPPGAAGPSGPVLCLGGLSCGEAPCSGPMYAFLEPCPLYVPAPAQPPVYLCMADVWASMQLGVACPVVSVQTPDGPRCFWVDWQNARPDHPPNYTRLAVGQPMTDGCCACLPPPCTRALAVECLNSPGVTGQRVGSDCCAHAINGSATMVWSMHQFVEPGHIPSILIDGTAQRSGGVLTGSWRRRSYGGGVLILDETFPLSGAYSLAAPFSPLTILNPDPASGQAMPTTWCPLTANTTGSWSSSCTSFRSNWQHTSNPGGSQSVVTTVSAVYTCDPATGPCATGCSSTTLNPDGPIDPTPSGPGGGDSLGLPDFTPLLDALA